MATRSVRLIATVAFAGIVASCGGGSGPTAEPASQSLLPSIEPASAAPSPAASLSQSSTATATATAEVSGPPATTRPRPSLDAAQLAAYLTATLSLFDVADADVSVSLTYIDPTSGPYPFGTYSLASSEHLSHAVPPGTYRIAFQVASASGHPPSCTIEVKDGSTVTFFVASPDAIAVTRTGFKPAKSADLFVATSSLCKAKA